MKISCFFIITGKSARSILFSIVLSLLVIFFNYRFFSGIIIGDSILSNQQGTFMNYDENLTLSGGKLAIIIDDFGSDRSGVKEMMSIDRHLTFAVMPFLSYTQSDAEAAHEKGYEIIVHLPMESYKGKLSWVGPRPILSVMSDNEIQGLVIDAFESVPHAVGANIHMGAKAGGDTRVISDVLDIIKAKNLYFVDSRATKSPIAKKIADEKGVLCYDRDVFLDGKKGKDYIKKQLKISGEVSLRKGFAVAIGHVGTEGGKVTANAIKEMLPYFDSNKIKLVFVSELEGK